MGNKHHFTMGETASLSTYKFERVGDTLRGRIVERREQDIQAGPSASTCWKTLMEACGASAATSAWTMLSPECKTASPFKSF